jgi:hypothetical protein
MQYPDFRAIITCFLSLAATAGCAQLRTASVQGYCAVGAMGQCSQLEGSGDCEPCPDGGPFSGAVAGGR